MLQAAKLTAKKMKRDIIIFAIVNCIIYIILFLSFKFSNMLHIFGLRMVNYIILGLISIVQVHRWIKKGGGYVPFLEVFVTIFFTGTISFFLFAIFVFLYSFFDTYFLELYLTMASRGSKIVPSILSFFEGSGISIIIALIATMYSGMYEDGEKTIN